MPFCKEHNNTSIKAELIDLHRTSLLFLQGQFPFGPESASGQEINPSGPDSILEAPPNSTDMPLPNACGYSKEGLRVALPPKDKPKNQVLGKLWLGS